MNRMKSSFQFLMRWALIALFLGADCFVAERQGQAVERDPEPLALASSDVDEDGVLDLLISYHGLEGGRLTLQRGNQAARFPNHPTSKELAQRVGTAPFLPVERTMPLPVEAGFLAVGDFDADGHQDIVAAARGKRQLWFLRGDGRGGFSSPQPVTLPGGVTALCDGDVNRADGLTDLLIGVESGGGFQLLVYEGAEGALMRAPEVFALPAAATAMAIGRFDDDAWFDFAVATGERLMVVRGRDRKLSQDAAHQSLVEAARTEVIEFPAQLQSLAVGDFSGHQQHELAVLLANGGVRLLKPQSHFGLTAARGSGEIFRFQSDWTDQADRESFAATRLVAARVSSEPRDQLLIADRQQRRLLIVGDETARQPTRLAFKNSRAIESAAALPLTGEPVAVLPARLNADALNDLILLQAGSVQPTLVLSEPQRIFTVTNTNENGSGSLTQALLDANNSPGMDQVIFNLPGAGPHSISLFVAMFASEALILDGTTQPGYNGSPVIEITSRISLLGGNSTVRGVAINKQIGPTTSVEICAVYLKGSGNNLVEACFIGLPTSGVCPGTGICPAANFNGIVAEGSSRNIIGGTVAAARNVVYQNRGRGVLLNGDDNQVLGNYIGVDATGGGMGAYIGIFLRGANNVIGGTQPGAGNLISGASQEGIHIEPATGARIQGNLIGTDRTGTTSNGGSAPIRDYDSTGTLIGGTTPAARNVMGGGPCLYFSSQSPLVQGNFLGVDATGNSALPGGCGVSTGFTGTGLMLGGVVGGARNLIAGTMSVGNASIVQGNYFGVNAAGTAVLDPPADGDLSAGGTGTLVGGVETGAGNVISGQKRTGFSISNGARLEGNLIGVLPDGVTPAGNGGYGVAAGGVTVGGTSPGAANLIAFNRQGGVALGNDNTIVRGNSIHSNGQLGLDVAADGLSQFGQQPPSITLATTAQGGLTLQGALQAQVGGSYLIDFYGNDACDPSGYGEGKQYLGTTVVVAQPEQSVSFTAMIPGAFAPGQVMTAAATRLSGGTTEFSACAVVVGDCVSIPPGLSQTIAADGGQNSINVSALSGCSWVAASDAEWLALSNSSGAGNGTINYTVARNPGAAPRVGFITLKDRRVRVIQAGRAAIVSAASFSAYHVAGDAIVSCFGVNLATGTASATTLPLPTTLAGTTIKIKERNGREFEPRLFFVSPGQINFLMERIIPDTVTARIINGDGLVSEAEVKVEGNSGALFTANASGQGVPAGVVLRVRSDGSQSYEPLARYDSAQNLFVPTPIDLGPEGETVFLILFGTGFPSPAFPLTIFPTKIGGITAEVTYVGRLPDFVSLDQINIRLPRNLAGRGQVAVEMMANGRIVNDVLVNIR